MRKVALSFAILLSLTAYRAESNDTVFEFRGNRFGDSIENVRSRTKALKCSVPIKDETKCEDLSLLKKDSFGFMSPYLGVIPINWLSYYFYKNRLYRIMLSSTPSEYNNIYEILVDKFGQPDSSFSSEIISPQLKVLTNINSSWSMVDCIANIEKYSLNEANNSLQSYFDAFSVNINTQRLVDAEKSRNDKIKKSKSAF